jgi:K+-sensing histidine kinase KdpD
MYYKPNHRLDSSFIHYLSSFWKEVGMHEIPRARMVAYSVAVLAPAVSLLIRWPLWPVMGDAVPHMTFFPAVMVAAYCGGFWPGLLASVRPEKGVFFNLPRARQPVTQH